MKLQLFYKENPFLTEGDKHDKLLERCISVYPHLDSEEEEIERKELNKEVMLMEYFKRK